ncbi:hypothetical protein [Buchnera aphidicola]|uniref:hypothetical protein n=1 Tax=Buchnera aphidicola TaxID=9 RepID=UPI0031B6AFDA
MEKIKIIQKIAIFLLSLNKRKIIEVLKFLDKKEIIIFSEEMFKIDKKLLKNSNNILKEFLEVYKFYFSHKFQNFDQVMLLLKNSIVKNKDQNVIKKPQIKYKFLNKILFLNTLKSFDIFNFLKNESSMIISIFLIYLKKKKSLKIFFLFKKKKRLKIFKNIKNFTGIKKFGFFILNRILKDKFKKFNFIIKKKKSI